MAIIPSTFKLDWYDPSQPGGVTSGLNDNANTATSNATQYTMEDIINTVSYTGGSIDGSGTQWALPVFTDTNTITNLPLGLSNQVLNSGGPAGDPFWADLAASPYEVGAGTDSAQLVAGTNTAAGDYSVVAGGVSNCAPNTACYQTISGGFTNLAEGAYAAIGGGLMNCELPQAGGPGYNTIAGGSENVITGLGGGFIGGGQKNYQIEENATAKSGLWAIGGGAENIICNPVGVSGGILAATIAGGMGNKITEDVAGKSMETPTIGGGGNNCIYGVEKNGTIAGGGSNTLNHADSGIIAGGDSNEIVLAKQGFIGGGNNNSIPSGSDESTIVGGINNDAAGFSNVHIIGSNITATRTGTTYVGGFNIGQAVPLTAYADNAAALLGGLTIGDVYRQTTTAGGDLLGIVH